MYSMCPLEQSGGRRARAQRVASVRDRTHSRKERSYEPCKPEYYAKLKDPPRRQSCVSGTQAWQAAVARNHAGGFTNHVRSPARLLEHAGMADYRLGLTTIAYKRMTTHKNVIQERLYHK